MPHPTAPAPPPRRARLILLAVVLLLVGFGIWRYVSVPAEEPAELTLQGNIDVRQVNLSFKVTGRIDTLAVDEGDLVRAGQVVATLEQKYFEDDLRLARAQRDAVAATLRRLENGSRPEEIAEARALVAERKATLERAREDLDRTERAFNAGSASRQDLALARATRDEAEARLKSSEQALRLAEIGPREEDIAQASAQHQAEEARVIVAERNLADSRLVAPNDGFILTRAREKGAIVQAGETVFTLTLTSPVWVRTYVNEPDLGFVQPGMSAAVTTDSAPDRPYTGHIGFISPTAEFTPKTVETRELRTDLVYRLRVIVDSPDGGLRQGMPVTVRLALPGPRPKPFWKRVRQAAYLDRLGLTG
ncbi:MAG TPA: secretion protein HlyD [Gemmataceae bacterium]|nr:secretion protein HlyD [Gemmataceae bacterium]